MTSNLASDVIAKYGQKLLKESETNVQVSENFKDTIIRPLLKKHFKRDEFLGRINEIVYFLPFSKSELNQLVVKELRFWAKRAEERHGIEMSWDNSAIELIASKYKVHYGARSIKHEVERSVVNKIALAHRNRLINSGVFLHITVDENLDQKKSDNRVEPKIKLQIKVKNAIQTHFIDLPID